jgi:hypothetical protein
MLLVFFVGATVSAGWARASTLVDSEKMHLDLAGGRKPGTCISK